MTRPSREDLAWAAGLFEGEGCFYRASDSRRDYLGHGGAIMSMTDQDVIERFARIIGFGHLKGPLPRANRPSYKPIYRWETRKFETVQALGAMLWPWLGVRRKEQFRTAMTEPVGRQRQRYRRTRSPDHPAAVIEA